MLYKIHTVSRNTYIMRKNPIKPHTMLLYSDYIVIVCYFKLSYSILLRCHLRCAVQL